MCRKQLKEPFSMGQLHETIVKISDLFMNAGEPNYWISYLVPENADAYRQLMAMSSNGFDDTSMLMDITKLEQLMLEARIVLSRYANSNGIKFPDLHLDLID